MSSKDWKGDEMEMIDMQRAWRDGEYFLSLSDEQKAMVPNSPAGAIRLDKNEMAPLGVCRETYNSWCFTSACITNCSCIC